MANYGLIDDHEPIDIIERQIFYSNQQNVIVAEDNISQLLTYRTERYQEGIDLMSKTLFFDYLDPLTNVLYNSKIKSIVEEKNDEGELTGMVLIQVPVIYEYTQIAGLLNYAISAIDFETTTSEEAGDSSSVSRQYIWQTLPSALTIKPNLAKRNAEPNVQNVATGYEELITTVETLGDDVEAILASDIYNADSGESEDGEVVFDGGDSTSAS